jgi:hypothetical protein
MRCRRPLIPATAVAAAAAALVAGCGGGSSPGVANVSNSTSTASPSPSSSGGPPTQAQLQREQRDATRFAQCMRSHGVPFPDPTVAPRAFKNAFNTQSPAFRSAYTVCGHLLPAGRPSNQNTTHTQAQTVALLAFARCVRNHGFPSFPDPTSGGELTREMLARAGIDLHQAALVQAADACTSVTHGVITRAVVARFVAGQ